MTQTGIDVGGSASSPWGSGASPAAPAGVGVVERAGQLIRPNQKLGQVIPRRPVGITAHQWNTASRESFDFVVWCAAEPWPSFAVELVDPVRPARAQRDDRMKYAVCAAADLAVLRIESGTLRPEAHGRRIVEYLVDARAFLAATGGPPGPDEPVDDLSAPLNFRDIIGRLPDGRRGHVNDLGAVARTIAVDAYVDREVVDPIIRSFHLDWRDGPAEGWAWVQVRGDEFLFERVRLRQHRFSCGIAPGRLAEDLATMAVGERLRLRDDTEPPLHHRDELRRELAAVRRRRDELINPYAVEHVSFDRAVPA